MTADITPIDRGKHPAGQSRWLRAVALQTAAQLVVGMARPSDEGAETTQRYVLVDDDRLRAAASDC